MLPPLLIKIVLTYIIRCFQSNFLAHNKFILIRKIFFLHFFETSLWIPSKLLRYCIWKSKQVLCTLYIRRNYVSSNLVWFYKKRCDFFSTEALCTRFLNFKKNHNFFHFFLNLRKIWVASYKGVAYKIIPSVSRWIEYPLALGCVH